MGKYTYDHIRRLLQDGYPYRIIGNDGYEAVLVGIQPLLDHEYCAIYRYPGGDGCHFLDTVKRFTVLEQYPPDWEEYLNES